MRNLHGPWRVSLRYRLRDPKISLSAVISATCGIAFVLRTLASAHPIVDLRALADRNFLLGYLFSSVTGAGIFCMTCLTVLFLGRVRGLIAWQNSDTIIWAGLLQLLTIPIYVAVSRYIDLRWLLTFGLAASGSHGGCSRPSPISGNGRKC